MRRFWWVYYGTHAPGYSRAAAQSDDVDVAAVTETMTNQADTPSMDIWLNVPVYFV